MSDTKTAILALSDGNSSQLLIIGKANTLSAKAGAHYRLSKREDGAAEQLVDDLVAKRSGHDLQLAFADGTQLSLLNYFTECGGASCDITLPGDHGSEFKLSGDSAEGAALGDGSHLVYVHGSHDVVMDMAQGNSALISTLSGLGGDEITYVPPANSGAFVAWTSGAALALGAMALASGGGSQDTATSPPASVHNIVAVSVVAGPVIEANGLTVKLYQADGTTLLGSGKLSATGSFSFDVGGYTGVVIAKVQDDDSGANRNDYIDEASGQARDLTANLMAVGVVNSGIVNLNINVLTTIAATKAGVVFDGVSAQHLTADAVVQTNAAVANAFGLADLTGSPVVSTVNTSGTANAGFTPDTLSVAEKYGAVLAAFSGMDLGNGGVMQTAIDHIAAGLTITGGTALLDTAALDSLIAGARTAAVNTNGAGDASLTAVISNLTVKTSPSLSINHIATDDVIVISEPNSVISGTTLAGAAVNLSIGGHNQVAVVNGTNWTYTLTASDISAMGQGGQTISATATLSGGETATATRSIVVDSLPPTVLISSNDSQLTSGEVAMLTFTLSDASSNFDAGDVVVAGGVLSHFSGSGTTYTASFTPTPNSHVPASINVLGGSFTSASGNPNLAATELTLSVDTGASAVPVITSGATAAVAENSATSVVVYTATASGAGAGTVLSYRLGGQDAAAFNIDSATGKVTLIAAADFETKSSYSFNVVAGDGQSSSTPQAVTLAVHNLDEVAPAITSATTATAIDENSGAGQVIYTVSSTDAADIASGATVYSLKAATGDAALLGIDGSTGAVTLTGNPDFESKASYSFTVVATDAAGNASEKAVTLAVNNLDEVAPNITSGTTASAIDENSGAGQVIYTVSSTDAADIVSGATVYSLKAATGDAALLGIDGSTGAVTLTGNPDFESKASYSFTVVATDAAGNAGEKAVTLAINDLVDETPPQVGSVTISGASGVQNNTLNAGDVVSVTVTMDEVTVVDTTGGTPRIALDIGGSTVYASYASGSGTAALVFQYTVSTGQADVNGIGIDADSLSANGGTMRDAAGNAAVLTHLAVADNAGFLVDTTAPTANFTSATDDVPGLTGPLISGDRTNDSSLALAGTCEAGATVNVYNGASLLGAATVSGTSWSYSAALTDGSTYQFTVKESDLAGNTSAATSNFTVVGDTSAPTAHLTSATDDVGSVTGALISGARTDDTSLVLAGSCEAGATVNVYDGASLLGAATVSGTSWSYSAAIVDGATYQFNVIETDIAGNTSLATSSFTVVGDTIAPTANFSSATDDVGSVTGTLISGAPTDDTSLALAGTCEAGATVNVYNGASLLGAATVSGTGWSYSAAIADGTTYQFNVKETDIAGNASAVTSNFTVIGDTTPPTAHFVSATDDAGSLTGTLINGARTDDTSLALAGTCEAGATVNVYNGASLLGAATVSGTSWSYSAALVNGASYQFNERETDIAGNTSVATSNFTVTGDTSVTAHLTSVTDDVGSIIGALVNGAHTDDSSLVLAGTCEPGSIVYIYDGVSLIGAGTVTGTSWSYTASIADGTSYLFNVTENDVAGNHSAHTSNFAVIGDASAPTLSSSSPADNAIGVAANSNIVLSFNENVLAGSGNVLISDGSGDVRTISIADSSQVSISGSVLTINPSSDLQGSHAYDVTMSAGVITDTSGNSFSGIAQDARDFTTAASLDPSVVIFDLVQGVSSAHSSRTFSTGVDYTIYIRVSSGNAPLAHSGAHGDTWGQWSGANNLDANDKVVLVGTGTGINIASGQAVNARGQGSGPGTIQWGRLGGLSSWAANLTNTGLFRRNFSGNPVGGATMSNGIYLWHANAVVNNGPWSNVHGFPGKATGALWMNALPANVLTTQGLAS